MVWSDPRILELSAKFLPVAETQFRLRREDSLSHYFQELAERAHYADKPFITRQGVYIVTAEGQLLASTGPTSADSVFAVMSQGLKAWSEGPAPVAPVSVPSSRVRIEEDSYPEEGLVLEMTARDLDGHEDPPDRMQRTSSPFPARSASITHPLNFDHVWFSEGESRAWIPEEREIGRSRFVPDSLVVRIACLHWLDSVSGLPPTRFLPEDLGGSWIRSEIIAFEGTSIRLRFTGETGADAKPPAFGASTLSISTQLLGYATYDEASRSFVRFDAVALARRFKVKTVHDAPVAMSKNIGFAMTLARPNAPRTPPHFLHRYDVEWVVAHGIHEECAETSREGQR